jgi:hypothetical protein
MYTRTGDAQEQSSAKFHLLKAKFKSWRTEIGSSDLRAVLETAVEEVLQESVPPLISADSSLHSSDLLTFYERRLQSAGQRSVVELGLAETVRSLRNVGCCIRVTRLLGLRQRTVFLENQDSAELVGCIFLSYDRLLK